MSSEVVALAGSLGESRAAAHIAQGPFARQLANTRFKVQRLQGILVSPKQLVLVQWIGWARGPRGV